MNLRARPSSVLLVMLVWLCQPWPHLPASYISTRRTNRDTASRRLTPTKVRATAHQKDDRHGRRGIEAQNPAVVTEGTKVRKGND